MCKHIIDHKIIALYFDSWIVMITPLNNEEAANVIYYAQSCQRPIQSAFWLHALTEQGKG